MQLPEWVVSDPAYIETLLDVVDYQSKHDGRTR